MWPASDTCPIANARLPVQSVMGKFLVSNSPYNIEFTIKRSNITFNTGAQMELSNGNVNMMENRFEGNGTIKMGVTNMQKRSTQVLSNIFDGVDLRFTKAPDRAIVLRNNVFENGSHFDHGALLQQCDDGDAKTGLGAGCDPRAECAEPVQGDVQCQCTSPLTSPPGLLRFKKGFLEDGSKCELDGEHLDIFQGSRIISARVRKPESVVLPFSVRAQSETSFNVAFDSSAPEYLVVENWRQYNMSSAKSDQTQDFLFTLRGDKMKWSDGEKIEARITVRPQSNNGDRNRKTSASVDRERDSSPVWLVPTHKGLD